MRFFNVRETLEPLVSSMQKDCLRPFRGLKMNSSRVMRLLASVDQVFVILAARKSDSCRVVKYIKTLHIYDAVHIIAITI